MNDNNTTNANHADLAQALADVDGGTLVSLVNRKKGVERGRRGSKTIYNNDLVHVLIWSGHDYEDLVRLSDERLLEMEQTGTLHKDLMAAANAKGLDVSVQVTCAAVSEVRERFLRRLGSGDGPPPRDETAHFRPLEVDGEVIRGCVIYCGPSRPLNLRAPKPGTIYIRGIKVGEKVLEPAPQWKTDSKPKTILKELLEKQLPSGPYVQYILTPSDDFELKMGKEASKAADESGIKLRAAAVHDVIQLASS